MRYRARRQTSGLLRLGPNVRFLRVIFRTAFLFFLTVRITFAGETYVLIDAVKIPSSSDQPTWIGIRGFKPFKYIHVPVGETVVPMEPGKYRIEHFHLQKHYHNGVGMMHISQAHSVEFEVVENAINFVGIIKIERQGASRLIVNVVRSNKLIAWGCHKNPEIFKDLPLLMVTESGEKQSINVNCET